MARTWDPTIPVIITASAMVAGVMAATGGLVPGAWKATLAANRASLRLEMRLADHGSDARVTTDLPTRELEGFDADRFSQSGAPLRFAWKRDAGSFVLEGTGGRHPAGNVRFEASAPFRDAWRELGLPPASDGDLFLMALDGVRLEDVKSLKASGLTDLDVRGVIDLERDSDAARWVKALAGRATPLRLEDVFRLRNHGLNPESFREYEASGVPASVEEIVRLHDHGVSPEYVAAARTSGLRDIDVEGIIRLHDQGIDTDYVRGLTGSGLGALSLEGIVRLHAHGVPTDYAHAVADFGPGDRAVDDAIRLHDTGVSTEFMRSRAKGDGERATTEGTIRSWSRGGVD